MMSLIGDYVTSYPVSPGTQYFTVWLFDLRNNMDCSILPERGEGAHYSVATLMFFFFNSLTTILKCKLSVSL